MTQRSSKIYVSNILLVLVFIFYSLNIKAQNNTSKKQTISSYYNEARELRNKNDISSAIETLNKAISLAKENKNSKAIIDSYQKIALLHIELNNHDDALFYRDRAQVILKKTEYRLGEATQKLIDATILYREKNNFQAISLLKEARLLSNDKDLINNIELTEATIYINIEKYEEAKKRLNALLVNSDVNERAYLATKANLGLASLTCRQKELEKSTKYGEAALKLSKRNNFFREELIAS